MKKILVTIATIIGFAAMTSLAFANTTAYTFSGGTTQRDASASFGAPSSLATDNNHVVSVTIEIQQTANLCSGLFDLKLYSSGWKESDDTANFISDTSAHDYTFHFAGTNPVVSGIISFMVNPIGACNSINNGQMFVLGTHESNSNFPNAYDFNGSLVDDGTASSGGSGSGTADPNVATLVGTVGNSTKANLLSGLGVVVPSTIGVGVIFWVARFAWMKITGKAH